MKKAAITLALLPLALAGCQESPNNSNEGTTREASTTAGDTTSPRVVVTEETTAIEVIQYSSDSLPDTGGVKVNP